MLASLWKFFSFGQDYENENKEEELASDIVISQKEEEELFYVEVDNILDKIKSFDTPQKDKDKVSIDYSCRNDRLTITVDKLRDSMKQTFFYGDEIGQHTENTNDSTDINKGTGEENEDLNISIDYGISVEQKLLVSEEYGDSQNMMTDVGELSSNKEAPIIAEKKDCGEVITEKESYKSKQPGDDDQLVPSGTSNQVEFSDNDDGDADMVSPLVDIDKIVLSCDDSPLKEQQSPPNGNILENSHIAVDFCHSESDENQSETASSIMPFETPQKKAIAPIIDILAELQNTPTSNPMSPIEKPILPNLGLEFPASPIRTRTRKRKILEEKKLNENNNRNDLMKKAKGSRIRAGRMKFSKDEEQYIIQGVKKYGTGRWVEIVKEYPFHGSRTNVDIKDKYRTMKKSGYVD